MKKATIYITSYQNYEKFDGRYAAARDGYCELIRCVRDIDVDEDGVLRGIALIGGRRIPVISWCGDDEFFEVDE